MPYYSNLDEDQIYTIRTVVQIISVISIFSSIVVLMLYIILKEMRQIAFELVLWLCFSVFFFSLSSFIPYDTKSDNTFWCATQSFIINSFQFSSWIWCAIIGFTAFLSVDDPSRLELNECKFRLVFFSVGFVFPMLLSFTYIIL